MRKIAVAALLACVSITAAPASAAVQGVKSIVITNALNTWLQVGEFDAFTTSNVNVAKAGSAVATDSHQGGYEIGHEPQYAIDGNYGTNYYDSPIFHSATDVAGTSLTITLNDVADLTSVDIYGRSDCCSERDIYNVDLLDTAGSVLYSLQLNAFNDLHFASANLPGAIGAAPEPSTWAMMMMGIGGIGAALRRRPKTKLNFA